MINELQNKLHSQIPMTKLMNLKIEDYNDKELITTAPLDININDKGTAFGGSLATNEICRFCVVEKCIKKLNLLSF